MSLAYVELFIKFEGMKRSETFLIDASEMFRAREAAMEERRKEGERRHHRDREDDTHRRHRDRRDDKHAVSRDGKYERYVSDDRDRSREDRKRSRSSSRRKEHDNDKDRATKRREHEDQDDKKDTKRKRDSHEHESQNARADHARDDKRKRGDAAALEHEAGKFKAETNGHPLEQQKQLSPSSLNLSAPEKSSQALSEIAKAKKVLQMRTEISEKLKKLPQLSKLVAEKHESPTSAASEAVPSGVAPNLANYEAVKRAQECFARLGFQQPPGAMPLLPVPGAAAPGAKTVKAPVLRLDAQGREIDENGVVVDQRKSTNVSTLKVNINKQKKDAFQILRPELEEDPVNNPHFDSALAIDKTKLIRSKRSTFQFVEEGRWSKQAEVIRLNNQFGAAKAREIRAKQAVLAKAKAEGDINPNLIEVTERIFKDDKHRDPIPDVEWWDANLLPSSNYSDVTQGELKYKKDKINIYVEHPVPIEPPAEPAPPPPQPLKLTKKEQKKMRTQRRLAREKDRQELIRQGKIEAPKPKVKMSNMMKVLGAEATQDPTRLEQEIRSAAAERERAHVDRNLARKLTPAERREKKEKRLFDDPNTLETIVAVYRVNDISHPQTRFKVDINAQENRLTGCVVITDAMTVVIVEGGPKSIKRYNKLMLRRINWAAKEDGDEGDGSEKENRCVLVWQGSVAKPAFDRFMFQKFHTPGAVRKYLTDAGVSHYWDRALNYIEE